MLETAYEKTFLLDFLNWLLSVTFGEHDQLEGGGLGQEPHVAINVFHVSSVHIKRIDTQQVGKLAQYNFLDVGTFQPALRSPL